MGNTFTDSVTDKTEIENIKDHPIDLTVFNI